MDLVQISEFLSICVKCLYTQWNDTRGREGWFGCFSINVKSSTSSCSSTSMTRSSHSSSGFSLMSLMVSGLDMLYSTAMAVILLTGSFANFG